MPITPYQAKTQLNAMEQAGKIDYITALNVRARISAIERSNPNRQLPDDYVTGSVYAFGQEHGSSEGGTYTSATGQRITSAQAQQQGIIDRPGYAAEKLSSIGAGASTSQIEARMAVEDAFKAGTITGKEAIDLIRRNIENRPLEIIRTIKAKEELQSNIDERVLPFISRVGLYKGAAERAKEEQAARRQARPERVYVTIAGKRVPFVSRDEYKGLTTAQTLQKAGGLRTTAAILSSTELFAKAAETEARGIGKVLGFDSKYDQALAELAAATSSRLKSRPGALEVLLESPVTAAVPVGVGLKVGTFAARAALVGTAGKISKISPQVANILKTGSLAVEPVVGAGVLGYVGKDLLSSKDYYEAIGKIATYGVMTPGAAFGYKQATKGITAFQTRGLETVPAPISPEVLAGKVTFPTTRAGKFKTFREEFRDIEGKFSGYHATAESFGKGKVVVRGLPEAELRPLDVPGLYISPYKAGASPVFLRLPGEGQAHINKLSGLRAFLKSESSTLYMGASKEGLQPGARQALSSSALKPEVNLIRNVKDIQRIAKSGGKNVAETRNILRGTVRRTGGRSAGVGFIEPKIEMGGFRGEAQAVLPPETVISGILSSKRFKLKGQYIPLVERSILPSEGKAPIKELPFEARTTNNILRARQYYESGGVRPMAPIGYSTTRKPSRPAVSSSLIPSSILKQYSRPESSISRTKSSMSIISSILKVPPSRTIPSSERKAPASRAEPSVSRKQPSRPKVSVSRKIPSRQQPSTARKPISRPQVSTTRKTPTRKKPKLTPKRYESQIEDFAKARKKRGKFVWNIRNQIPTLESLIG